MPRAGRLAHHLSRFGPPIALMGVIFALSAQPDLNSGLGTIDLVGRKLVHATEYGLLYLLWLRALRWRTRAGWVAATITIAYAITDELHQTFVSGRHGVPTDVLIDSTGVLIAFLLQRRFASVSSFVRSHDREARTGSTGKRSGGLTGDEAPRN